EYAAESRFQRDVLTRVGIHAGTARQIGALWEQFLRIARAEGLGTGPGSPNPDNLRKCILIAFSDRVGRRLDESSLRYELVHGRRGVLARDSVARESALLVFAEIREVDKRKGDVNTVLSLATGIDEAWLAEL